jgi:hypothetical protein
MAVIGWVSLGNVTIATLYDMNLSGLFRDVSQDVKK